MTFAQRSFAAQQHEQSLPAMLVARGWAVEPWGMGSVPPAMRHILHNLRDSYGRPCLWRWIPDLLIGRELFRKCEAYLVDAKTTMESNRNSTNYAIELNAIQTYRKIEDDFNIPVLMVAPSGGVLTVHTVLNRGAGRIQDGNSTNGSGTAYMLISKIYATEFDQTFGRPGASLTP
jgi:hypothetical protein